MAAFPSQQDYFFDQSDEIFNSFSFPVGDPSSEFFNVAPSAEGVQPPLSSNFSPSPLLSASSTPTACTGALPPGQSTASASTPSAPAYPAEQTMQGYQWQSFNASGRSTAELPFQQYPTHSQREATPLPTINPELLDPSLPGAPLPLIAPHLRPDPHAANSQAGSSTGSKRSAFGQGQSDGCPPTKKAKGMANKKEYICTKIPGCKFVGKSAYELGKHQEKKATGFPEILSSQDGNGAESIGNIKPIQTSRRPSRQSALEIPVPSRDFNPDVGLDLYDPSLH
ncbi:hypothetical protein KEM48_013247 [Puccinia striiformis f. sp. tritici PST-130]|nr:hypothetical protein KEM48_013247 [Puccinia striiformis f. sp. tritici PST-130]